MSLFSRFCRDCKQLNIEITYAGAFEYPYNPLNPPGTGRQNKNALIDVQSNWLPQLEWMMSLKSLVLIKLGVGCRVISRLLDALSRYLFPPLDKNEEPALRPLECIWIKDFEVWPYEVLRYANPECLQSYHYGCPRIGHGEDLHSFKNIVNAVPYLGLNDNFLLPSLTKLKYYCGSFNDKEVELHYTVLIYIVLYYKDLLHISFIYAVDQLFQRASRPSTSEL